MSKKKKEGIIKKVQLHPADTGSSRVQQAILETRVEELARHLKRHRKDFHSRRGLLELVARRRRHEKYLEKQRTK